MENQENPEWQSSPPPPAEVSKEQPEMSEVGTLVNIFFEPGRTFEDLRRKPRFIMATIIVALLVTAWNFGLYYKFGEAAVRRTVLEQVDKSPQVASMSAEQKAGIVDMNMMIGKVTRFAMPVLFVFVCVIGGLLYWLASKAFGGTGGFFHGWAVFVYSALPPALVSMIANFIVLGFKSADEINYVTSQQRGVIHANPSFLIDGKTSPVLATLVGTLDLFMIWGWVLAAIGLRITNRLSSGSAWAIVIIFALLGILGRVVGAFFGGNPT